MKCFYYSKYTFYHPKAPNLPKLFLISDVHFNQKSSSATLSAIVTQAQKIKPSHILIAGDLVNSLDDIEKPSRLKSLTSWLAELGQIAPVLISLGNHDFYNKKTTNNGFFNKTSWHATYPKKLITAVNAIDNVALLDNESYQDPSVYIFGFTQSPDYYQFDSKGDRSVSIFNPGFEDKNIMLSELHQLSPELIKNLPKDKIKVALVHSPVFLNEPDILDFFNEFDFIISGHMHNGAVPPVINDFWRSDLGILAPGKSLFPHQARTIAASLGQKNIICGPITTIPNISPIHAAASTAFPINIASLEFSDRQTLTRKPDTKHQYLSY